MIEGVTLGTWGQADKVMVQLYGQNRDIKPMDEPPGSCTMSPVVAEDSDHASFQDASTMPTITPFLLSPRILCLFVCLPSAIEFEVPHSKQRIVPHLALVAHCSQRGVSLKIYFSFVCPQVGGSCKCTRRWRPEEGGRSPRPGVTVRNVLLVEVPETKPEFPKRTASVLFSKAPKHPRSPGQNQIYSMFIPQHTYACDKA